MSFCLYIDRVDQVVEMLLVVFNSTTVKLFVGQLYGVLGAKKINKSVFNESVSQSFLVQNLKYFD